MDKWNDFLESLSTKGGNLLVLLVFTLMFMGLMIHVAYRHNQFGPEITTWIVGTASGFTGALLAALTGQARKNGNGNGETPKP